MGNKRGTQRVAQKAPTHPPEPMTQPTVVPANAEPADATAETRHEPPPLAQKEKTDYIGFVYLEKVKAPGLHFGKTYIGKAADKAHKSFDAALVHVQNTSRQPDHRKGLKGDLTTEMGLDTRKAYEAFFESQILHTVKGTREEVMESITNFERKKIEEIGIHKTNPMSLNMRGGDRDGFQRLVEHFKETENFQIQMNAPLGKLVSNIRSKGNFIKRKFDRLKWLHERGFKLDANSSANDKAFWEEVLRTGMCAKWLKEEKDVNARHARERARRREAVARKRASIAAGGDN